MPKTRVVIGLSGGVDSALAARMLLEQGYDVIGVTLRLLPCQDAGEKRSCCGVDGVVQARNVAGQLGIPHYAMDCREAFTELVLRPCWNTYAVGRTPNPCVLCNRHIKFGWMRDFAKSLGAGLVATGHYADITTVNGNPELRRGADTAKDQSYFLFDLEREQLAAALLPLGRMMKQQVRVMAKEHGLVNAERPESQDICFAVDDGGFAEFLRQRFNASMPAGNIYNDDGRLVGRHEGVHRFTIGQRRGVGVAMGRPAWVKEIHADSAAIVLTTDEKMLECTAMSLNGVIWHGETPRHGEEVACQVQTRYRQRPIGAVAIPSHDTMAATVRFLQPVKAVTPGQAAVFFDNDRVLGGGWITDTDNCRITGMN